MGRLEVALHAAASLHVCSGPFSCDTIVERDTVSADGLMEADIALACTTGEGDDGGVWVQSFQRSSDLRGGLYRVVDKVVSFERACPAVKYFHDFRACFDLL